MFYKGESDWKTVIFCNKFINFNMHRHSEFEQLNIQILSNFFAREIFLIKYLYKFVSSLLILRLYETKPRLNFYIMDIEII